MPEANRGKPTVNLPFLEYLGATTASIEKNYSTNKLLAMHDSLGLSHTQARLWIKTTKLFEVFPYEISSRNTVPDQLSGEFLSSFLAGAYFGLETAIVYEGAAGRYVTLDKLCERMQNAVNTTRLALKAYPEILESYAGIEARISNPKPAPNSALEVALVALKFDPRLYLARANYSRGDRTPESESSGRNIADLKSDEESVEQIRMRVESGDPGILEVANWPRRERLREFDWKNFDPNRPPKQH